MFVIGHIPEAPVLPPPLLQQRMNPYTGEGVRDEAIGSSQGGSASAQPSRFSLPMSPVEIIQDAQSTSLVDEDGAEVTLQLLPPLSESEIDEFAALLPCPLPADIRELLAFCRGFRGVVVDVVDFTGGEMFFGLESVFPHGIPIAGDGFGNFWVVDLCRQSTEFGPVYFACHDAPVILYQSDTLGGFLSELFRMCTPPHESLVDDVHEDRRFQVWSKNPGVMDFESCLESADASLREFAASLDTTWQIIDLRDAEPGFGFSWGRYGANTDLQRFGALPIFAYRRPRRLLGGLFG